MSRINRLAGSNLGRWCQPLAFGARKLFELPTRDELTSTCHEGHHKHTRPHFLHIACNRAGHCRTSIYALDTHRTLLSLVFVQRPWKSDWAWRSFAALMEAHLVTASLGVAEVDERERWIASITSTVKFQLQCSRVGVPEAPNLSALTPARQPRH